ncbi:MAG TPA: GGDEF domain-containing protein [Xanthomonadaceae bacterium]|nr:GGDEF domain-containing protein [Xanthomonadaceae bacterium]
MSSASDDVLPEDEGTLVPATASLRTPLLPRQLSDRELNLFIQTGTRRELAPGELIFRRGELGRSMFVIESGCVRLSFGDGLPDKLIGEREFIGELALFIGNHSRVASAAAERQSVVHVIEHAVFESLLQREPELIAQFMRRSFAYLVASEQQLVASLKRRNEDLLKTLHSLRNTRTQLDTATRLIHTDELTGLCNRRGLYAFLDTLPQNLVPGTQLCLLLIDLDRFKQINDLRGHLVGDDVLRAVAREVEGVAQPCDLPCRLGGDEFALLAQVDSIDEAVSRAREIVAATRSLRFPEPQHELRVHISVGGHLCDQDRDWSHWYTEADIALYEVKSHGGNSYHLPG